MRALIYACAEGEERKAMLECLMVAGWRAWQWNVSKFREIVLSPPGEETK
jgi:hypothetical protein